MSDAVQTTVASGFAAGRPGKKYDSSFSDTVTKIAAEAIPFGAWVCFEGNDNCELPDTEGEVTGRQGGVALIDPNKQSGQGYVAGDAVNVLRRGRVYVLSEETNIATGDAVYVRHTAGAGEQKGSFRNDADGTDADIPLGAAWFKGGTIPVLELGMGGSAGPTGATGPTGPTGPAGPTGPTGPTD